MMMQKIHDVVKKKWFAGTIFTLISLAFVLWGVTFYLHPGGNGQDAVAVVNGQNLTVEQLNRVYNALVQNNPELNNATPDQVKQAKQFALQSLVIQQIIKQQADKLGLSVAPEQVDALITQMPVFQVNGQFSQQRFQEFLYRSGQSMAQFVQELQQLLLVNQLSNFFQFSSFSLPDEQKRAYELVNQMRSFAYVVIPVKRFLAKADVTEAGIKSYYQQNQTQFQTPEKVKIAYIQLSPSHIMNNIHVSEAAAKQYYESNPGNYRTPEEWTVQTLLITGKDAQTKMQSVVSELKKGTAFAKVYQQNNGIEQTVNAGQLTDKEVAVLRSLKPGQLSQPIVTSEGQRIYHLISVKQATTKPFSAVKSEVMRLLVQQQANAKLSKLNSELSNITYTNPDSLAPAAKSLDTTVQTSEWFTRDGAKTGIASNMSIVSAAFSADVLSQGNNSDPITLKDGSVVVLRVAEHEPSKVLPLSDVKEKIKQQLQQQLAQAQAAIVSNEIVAGLRNQQTFSAVASKYDLSLHHAENVKQGDKNVPAAITAQAFSLTLPEQPVANTTLADGDTAVVELTGVKLGDYANATPKQRQSIAENLALEQARLTGKLYVNLLHQQAKIQVTDQDLQ